MFRVGKKLKTTIYRDQEEQPVAWVPNDPRLAETIVDLLNVDILNIRRATEESE
jgi:hypothetical protein